MPSYKYAFALFDYFFASSIKILNVLYVLLLLLLLSLFFRKDADKITRAFTELREAVGPLPLTDGQASSNGTTDGTAGGIVSGGKAADGAAGGEDGAGGGSTTVTKNVVLSDGTYATQTTVVGAYFCCFFTAFL